jgi:hypothetical protein
VRVITMRGEMEQGILCKVKFKLRAATTLGQEVRRRLP